MIRPLTLTPIPPEDEALRGPIREFLSDYLAATPIEKRARTWLGYDRDFTRALAAKGWVGLTLPKALSLIHI